MKQRTDAFECPHCGESVPARALACPGCGSDAKSGWSEDADVWGGDIPTGHGDDDDDGFDYEEFLKREGLAEDGAPSRDDIKRQRVVQLVVLLVICILLWRLVL
jgi:hypothetical protein